MPSVIMLCIWGFACAAAYYLFPLRMRWMVLLGVSFAFYATRRLTGLPFLLITILSVWLCAGRIGNIGQEGKARLKAASGLSSVEKKQEKQRIRKLQRGWMTGCLAGNLAILCVFKYTDTLLGWAGREPLGLLLPLGISFYIFQSVSYLLDVYNGKIQPERSLPRFALYVSFFPQLIQGPIGRYDALSGSLFEDHRFQLDVFERGLLLMLWGLVKKLVIADRAAGFIEAVFSAEAGACGGGLNLVAVLAYSLQQYCDFSGGIDLVTGIAELVGVRLAENFRRPYFSVSLGDFWRRWHISLGAWMRDYVFYPFALSKPVIVLSKAAAKRFGKEAGRVMPSVAGNIIVFLLVGLWHGATANYIVWGLYNGVLLALASLADPAIKRWNDAHGKLAESRGFFLFRVLRTFVIVNIGWFFDRAVNSGRALSMLGSIFTDFRPAQIKLDVLKQFGLGKADVRLLLIAAVCLFAVSLVQERGTVVRDRILARPFPVRWVVFLAGILCVLIFGIWGSGFSETAFIYYQF